jgi:hypothetical protein
MPAKWPGHPEARFAALLCLASCELKAAVLLTLLEGRKGSGELRDSLERLATGAAAHLLPSQSSLLQACRETLVPLGLASETRVPLPDGREAFVWRLTREGRTWGAAAAIHSLEQAAERQRSAKEFLGTSFTSKPFAGPYARAKVLETLCGERREVTEKELMERLGRGESQLLPHLRQLKRLGLIEFDSASTRSSGWARWAWCGGRRIKKLEGLGGFEPELVGAVASALRAGPGDLSELSRRLEADGRRIGRGRLSHFLTLMEETGLSRPVRFMSGVKMSSVKITPTGRAFWRSFIRPLRTLSALADSPPRARMSRQDIGYGLAVYLVRAKSRCRRLAEHYVALLGIHRERKVPIRAAEFAQRSGVGEFGAFQVLRRLARIGCARRIRSKGQVSYVPVAGRESRLARPGAGFAGRVRRGAGGREVSWVPPRPAAPDPEKGVDRMTKEQAIRVWSEVRSGARRRFPNRFFSSRRRRLWLVRSFVDKFRAENGRYPGVDDWKRAGLVSLMVRYGLSPLRLLRDAGYDVSELERPSRKTGRAARRVVPVVGPRWGREEVRLEAIRKAVRRIGKPPEEVSQDDLQRAGLTMVLKYYNSSPHAALAAAGFKVEPWRMQRVPRRFWVDTANRRRAVEWLMSTTGKDSRELMGRDFEEHGLSGLLQLGGGVRALLDQIGLEPSARVRRRVPNGYWKSKVNRVRRTRQLVESLGKPLLDITVRDFAKAGLGPLCLYKNGRVREVLREAGYRLGDGGRRNGERMRQEMPRSPAT